MHFWIWPFFTLECKPLTTFCPRKLQSWKLVCSNETGCNDLAPELLPFHFNEDFAPILLEQVLQTLTDGVVPSQDLVLSVRKLYNLKLKVKSFKIIPSKQMAYSLCTYVWDSFAGCGDSYSSISIFTERWGACLFFYVFLNIVYIYGYGCAMCGWTLICIRYACLYAIHLDLNVTLCCNGKFWGGKNIWQPFFQ